MLYADAGFAERFSSTGARMRDGPETARAVHAIESPYGPEARYCKRGVVWTGRSRLQR